MVKTRKSYFRSLHSRIWECAHGYGDLVDLVLAGGQARHPGPVVLLDGVELPQLPEHLVHALQARSLIINQVTSV